MTEKRVTRRRVLAGAIGVTAVAAGIGGLSQALAPGRLLEPWGESTPDPSPTSPSAGPARHLVIIGEQARREVLVLDAAVTDWRSADAVRWRWRMPSEWGRPGDVKLHNVGMLGGRVMLICTQQHIAFVSYPGGRVRWQVELPREAGAHTAEVLPGGLLAVAGTEQNWVRVYRMSGADPTGRNGRSRYVQVAASSPHGLQWDRRRKLLWALGYRHLTTMAVDSGGSPVSLAVIAKAKLPSGQVGGHDLTASRSRPGVLLLTTVSGIWGYDTRRHRFIAPAPASSDLTTHGKARAVGDWPDGRMMWNGPTPSSGGRWTTDTVRFRNPDATRRLPGARFYKSRPFLSAYT